jgi:putative ABC transport system permease protein
VDLIVDASVNGDDSALPADVADTVSGVEGVGTVVEMRTAWIQLPGDNWIVVAAPADGAVTDVVRDPRTVDGLADGTLLLTKNAAELASDGTIPVSAYATGWETSDPAPGGTEVPLQPVVSELGGVYALVTPATLEALAPRAAVSMLWVALDREADPALVLQGVRSALPDTPAEVSSAAAQRAGDEAVIDSLLGVVVGLLGVAVVIALIGVANTLSLSVLERRRESATLRAIGLSRRQLRWMLAVEGMLIAGVGAVIGVALGLLYGWAGAAVVFGEIGDVVLVVPWPHLALILAVALAAGLVASVLPGRAAARTSPVAALAVD